jgi:hypothetical protein
VLDALGRLGFGQVCRANIPERIMKTTFTTPLSWRNSLPRPMRPSGAAGRAEPRVPPGPVLQLRRPISCPKCRGREIRLILYGHPAAEALGMVWRGEACLGRRSIARWLPDWRCHDCGHEWFDPADPAKQELERLVERILAPAEKHWTLAA